MKKITMNFFFISAFIATSKIICVTSNRCTEWGKWHECVNGIISRICNTDPTIQDSIPCQECGKWVNWTSCFEGKTSRHLSNCPNIVEEKDCVYDINVNTLNSINNSNKENANYNSQVNSNNTTKNDNTQDNKQVKSLKFLEENLTETENIELGAGFGSRENIKDNYNTNFNQVRKLLPTLDPFLDTINNISDSINNINEHLIFKDNNYKLISEESADKINDVFKIKKHIDLSNDFIKTKFDPIIIDDDESLSEDETQNINIPYKNNTLLTDDIILNNTNNANQINKNKQEIVKLEENQISLPANISTSSTYTDTDVMIPNVVMEKIPNVVMEKIPNVVMEKIQNIVMEKDENENGKLLVHENFLRAQKRDDESTNTNESLINKGERKVKLLLNNLLKKSNILSHNISYIIVGIILIVIILVIISIFYNIYKKTKEIKPQSNNNESNSEIMFNGESKAKNTKKKFEEEFWVLE